MDWREAIEVLLKNVQEDGSVTVTVASVNGAVLEIVHDGQSVVNDVKVLLDGLRRWDTGVKCLLEREPLIE